jgi:uncharacterized protein
MPDVVRVLLQAKAEVDATAAVYAGASGVNTGLTALMQAAASGDTATVQLLLRHGANPNAKSSYEVTDPDGGTRIAGSTPVLMSASNADVLRVLVEGGADIHVKDRDGNSVLMHAAENLDAATVRYLLSKGLNVGDKNRKGLTSRSKESAPRT